MNKVWVIILVVYGVGNEELYELVEANLEEEKRRRNIHWKKRSYVL